MIITSVIANIKYWLTIYPHIEKNNPFGNYLKKYFIYENIPHTPPYVVVLQRIIFSHTPDEAMSGGLAKACVPGKNCSVPEKIEFLIKPSFAIWQM